MAQFDFFGTWEDSWEILEKVIMTFNCKLIPDLWYSSEIINMYEAVTEDLKLHLVKRRHLFILKQIDEVSMNGFLKNRAIHSNGQYRIDPEIFGETIELTLPACYKNNNITMLGLGMLTYCREYYNFTKNSWEKPTNELKTFYADLRKVIRRCIISKKYPKGKIWIGRDAFRKVSEGKADFSDRYFL